MYRDKLASTPVILIVDDAIANVRIMHDAVRDLGTVLFATDGSSALQMVSEHHPNIVLLDIEMPGINGYEVCRAIKAAPHLSDIAVIFVTSHDETGYELQALALGGVDFLQKPINAATARARVKTHLELQLKTRELALARQDLSDMIEHLPAFISYWDIDLKNEFTNDLHGRWFGVPARAMSGMHMRDVLGPLNFFSIDVHIEAVLRGENPTFDLTFYRDSGDLLYGQASMVCRVVEDRICGVLLLITDITERKTAEISLYDEKERIRVTLSSIGDAVLATDAHGNVTFLNPIAEDMTGWLTDEAVGQPIETVMPLFDSISGHETTNPIRHAFREKRVVGMAMNTSLRRRDGRLFQVEDSAAPIRDHQGEITGAIVVFHDVSEARAMLIKMTHLANYDALTNLPNRMLWHDRAEQAMQVAKRSGKHVGMILLDIDNFKSVNDTFSHIVGDNILRLAAQRLTSRVRPSDTVSRQGGDEFTILLPDLDGIAEATEVASKILSAMMEPFWVDGQRFDLSVSVGISLFPDDSEDQDVLYRHADAAMYRAKQGGKNRYEFFSTDIEEQLIARHMLERHMREAIDQGQYLVYYQAKVDVDCAQVVGVEALVRWKNSADELVSPAKFIPVAEETGLIVPLGELVMRRACEDARRWHERGANIVISINVSAVQFEMANFVDKVSQILHQTGVRPDLVELEITEGVLARNHVQARDTLLRLKELGLGIAIDDFGTGYSSLAYLKRFPIDVLKIDQGFVRDMLTDPSDAAIITAIVHLAQNLGLELVAEGVEVQEQAAALRNKGCRIMQGYLYSKPAPFDEISELIFVA
ncbi:hypothetical protein GCM10007907_24490 [Chitinimonas prasina]|uniref:EAL domain-containing protein n=1 Tax=Chitinimonas prasina TaxID=1434937 RepID=A0ABQ5YG31_9NEIS|nr:EAL domain-containing protein [Chitinimonas prasina]GLR13659.1 hypothetical protein GCM10007907_24490 [Chitinimonas prasina]